MSAVEWCESMQKNAKDGDEAMAYFTLANLWREREAKE